MQVSVEAPSKIQRRVTVTVPVEQFDKAYDKHIVKLSKTAKINGFRPGKIPLDVIKQRFGDTARQEAMSEVIQTSFYSAITQEKLNPVGVPKVEPKTVIPGQPLEFVATFEILPIIENFAFNISTIEKQMATIQDEDVTKVIDHLRQQHTAWQKVDRPAQDKDQVVIDFRGMIDGIVFAGGEAHDYPIVLGSKMMIPGFEEGIVGAIANEERTVNVTFPEEYFAKEVAGKKAEFAIKIIKVMQPNVPELNESFIKKLGVKSATVEELRAEIRKNLERELDRVIKLKLKTQVFNQMLEQNPLDIPQSLIEREAQRIHDELHPHHKGHEHHHTDAEMAQFNEAAKRNVALGLLVAECIKKHSITLDKDRLQKYIESISSAYENPSEVSKWYSTNKQARTEIEMQVLEEQVTEKLLESVQITEKMLSYNELIASTQVM